ncbi:hypothetical protein EXIGLDRAFT_815649 [Exidia glandulosa HHB12029]|uniref:Uncharacterized protein n=1 Tax=Exidia glandulosa HHB12029 TaxID=1314781 RepID=A0A165BID0_EXIGL|nr:hypothetical protein EXIGLDRAFT_815649 [Exidia glandulosa HHB12029]
MPFKIPGQLFSASAPNLRELSLRGLLRLDNYDHTVFRHLTNLTLDPWLLDDKALPTSFCSVQRLELVHVGLLHTTLVAPMQALTHLTIAYDPYGIEEQSHSAFAALDAVRFLRLQELKIAVPPIGLVSRILEVISDDIRVVRYDGDTLMFVSQSPYFRVYEFSQIPVADFESITDPTHSLLHSIEEIILSHSTSGRVITQAVSALVRAAPKTRVLNSVLPGVPILDANGYVQDVIYGWDYRGFSWYGGHDAKLALPNLQELRIIADPDGSALSILSGTIAEFIQSSIDIGDRHELSMLSLWNLHLVRTPSTDDGLVSFGLSDRVRMIDMRRHSGFATFH